MNELWIPFSQSEDAVVWGDLRMMGDDSSNREFNVGIGYREIVNTKTFGTGVVGVHGWFDRRFTEYGSNVNQLTTGFEWLGESFDVLVNAYAPLSDERYFAMSNEEGSNASFSGTQILVDTSQGIAVEEPQYGWDLELGLELGQYSDFLADHTDSFRVYGGGYYFDGPLTEDIIGARVRAAVDVTQDIQFGLRFQRDAERGSQSFVEATFRFPMGFKKSYRSNGIYSRLDESPERDIDIVTNSAISTPRKSEQVINADTGVEQVVLHVDNSNTSVGDGTAENPFQSLSSAEAIADAHSIIYVHAGDGTSNFQNDGVTIDHIGQQLIGSGANFYYDTNMFTTLSGRSPLSVLIASATSAPVIGNQNVGGDAVTVTADDVVVAGIIVDNDNTGQDGIVVVADGAAASARNVVIHDVTVVNSRMGIYLHGLNSGSVSAAVENSVTTDNYQHGIAVYDDTDGVFEIDLGGGTFGSLGNNVLAGNYLEDLAVDYDGRTLAAMNNWWGQATGPDEDDPSDGVDPQIYYGAPINDGLVGHWTFDSEWTTDTIAYDRSGNNYDGILSGTLSTASLVAGAKGEALYFNGTSDEVIIGDIAGLDFTNADDFTFFSYADPANTDTLGYAYSKTDLTAGVGSYYKLSSDTISMPWHGLSAPWDGDAVFTEDGWMNATSTFSNQNVTHYHNGVLAGTSGGNNFTTATGIDAKIGNRGGRTNSYHYFEGSLDDIRVYNRVLSAAEILELNRMDTTSTVNSGGYRTTMP